MLSFLSLRFEHVVFLGEHRTSRSSATKALTSRTFGKQREVSRRRRVDISTYLDIGGKEQERHVFDTYLLARSCEAFKGILCKPEEMLWILIEYRPTHTPGQDCNFRCIGDVACCKIKPDIAHWCNGLRNKGISKCCMTKASAVA